MSVLRDIPSVSTSEPRRWIIPGQLPAGELVFLDGFTGVGKSSAAAHYASFLSKSMIEEHPTAVLYLTSYLQSNSRNYHLSLNEANLARIKDVDYETIIKANTSDKTYVYKFIEVVVNQIKEHEPLLVVIDSMEEILTDSCNYTETDLRTLFMLLQHVARASGCTVLIPRTAGMHERHYSILGRAGTSIAEYIMTLHWHPVHADRRVLTVAKNIKGPMGDQWHHRYFNNGRFMPMYMEPHQHVKPARSPQTWKNDPAVFHRLDELIDLIRHVMTVEKITGSQELKDHIIKLGYKEYQFRQATSRMGLDSIRVHGKYTYLFKAEANQKYQEVQAQRESQRAESIEYQAWLRNKIIEERILNQQAHTEDSKQEASEAVVETITPPPATHTQRQAG